MNVARILLLLMVLFCAPLFSMGRVTYQKEWRLNTGWREIYAVNFDDDDKIEYYCVHQGQFPDYGCRMVGHEGGLTKYMLRFCSNDEKKSILDRVQGCKTGFYLLKKEYDRQQAL